MYTFKENKVDDVTRRNFFSNVAFKKNSLDKLYNIMIEYC